MAALFVTPLSCTVVSANEAVAAPCTNATSSDQAGLAWRSSNLTTINCILDLGSGAAFAGSYDTVALIGTNLRATDTVQIRTGTTSTGTGNYAGSATAAYTGTLPSGSTSKAIYSIGTRTERYMRIDIVATSHPDAYTSVQRIVVGKALALNNGAGVDLGHTVSFADQSVGYTGAGWRSYDRYARLPQMRLSVSMIGDTDWRTDWFGFLQDVGESKAFLAVPDNTASNLQVNSIFGTITQSAEANLTAFDMRRVDLTITAMGQ